MANLAAIYDASVLYPAPLRDLLMQLALSDLYRAHWTSEIHDEWIRNLLEDRPDLTLQQLQRTRELMDASVRDCLVENFSALIPSLHLPDPHDRHVLAAGIVAKADVIVTCDLKDFPRENLDAYGIEAQHPDKFISHLIEQAPENVYSAVAAVRARLRSPPISVTKYIDILESQSLPHAAQALRAVEARI
ncbi:MAG: PIN domain-containing protein [Gammaproteobacteria bacterium]|nr:PIN domain-containing protein [Gammaproteobacteria bacterium]